MTIYSDFQETYFDNNIDISIKLGRAICGEGLLVTSNLIEKYFSTEATKVFLEGHIAYQSKDDGGGKDGSLKIPAILAIERKRRDVFELIVKACRTPDFPIDPDRQGYTLLMYAAEIGDRETAETLISLGANLNHQFVLDNGFVLTPLGKAITSEFQKTAEFLISIGANFSLHEAMAAVESYKQLPQFIEDLIRKNPEFFTLAASNDQRTLLHHACAHGRMRTVRWLIENGSEINALDADGRTPLVYAIATDNNSIAEYLKSKGASDGAVQDKQEVHSEASKPEEITSLIERLELIEDKLGIRFDGIYGIQVKRTWENPIDFVVEVNFDVIGTEQTLSKSFSPTLSAYNASGQLVATNSNFINNDKFLGIESKTIQLICRDAPTRFRLFPANPI